MKAKTFEMFADQLAPGKTLNVYNDARFSVTVARRSDILANDGDTLVVRDPRGDCYCIPFDRIEILKITAIQKT